MNKIDTGDMDTSRPPFKNYIEADWETLNRQDDDVTVWLRDKYNGMILHDGEDGDDHEPRRIFKVIWQRQRPKGHLVSTGIIKSNGHVDQSEEAQQDYKINADLHAMISQELNPGFTFQQED